MSWGGVVTEILSFTPCYRNWDKLRLYGGLLLPATTWIHLVCLLQTTFVNGGVFVIPLYLCQLDLLASLWFKCSFVLLPCQQYKFTAVHWNKKKIKLDRRYENGLLIAFLSDLFGTVYASKSGGRFGICKSLRCVAHCAVEQFENGANFVWGDQLLERFCNGTSFMEAFELWCYTTVFAASSVMK